MDVVFDVDGCLIDSQELIRQSYHEAGITAPENVLAYEGVDWLHNAVFARYGEYVVDVHAVMAARRETASIHNRKNENYLWHLARDELRTLPAYDVAVRLRQDGHHCYAYTGAPVGTLAVLEARLFKWPFSNGIDGITTSQRMRDLSVTSVTGVYLDDQTRFVDVPAGWRFVHVTDQGADQLYEKIVRDA